MNKIINVKGYTKTNISNKNFKDHKIAKIFLLICLILYSILTLFKYSVGDGSFYDILLILFFAGVYLRLIKPKDITFVRYSFEFEEDKIKIIVTGRDFVNGNFTELNVINEIKYNTIENVKYNKNNYEFRITAIPFITHIGNKERGIPTTTTQFDKITTILYYIDLQDNYSLLDEITKATGKKCEIL